MEEHKVLRNKAAHTYTVNTKNDTTLQGYIQTLFDPVAKPLCAEIQRQHGSIGMPIAECAVATAFTSWTFSMPQDKLYNDDGTKRALEMSYDTSATIPKWSHIHHAHKHEAAEARRADIQTAYHEAGHQATPEALVTAILAFADAMPDKIDPKDVPATNNAVVLFITEFYRAMAYVADQVYDATTGHGLIQGAEYSDIPILTVHQPREEVEPKEE